MKQFRFVVLSVLVSFFLAFISCNDPTDLGSDLVAGDRLDLDFTDTITLKAYTQKQDSVITFDPIQRGVPDQAYFAGSYIDPVFGKTSASIYAQYSRNSNVSPNFQNATLDSLVLILPWGAAHNYGNINEPFQLDVYQLDQALNNSSFHFSNQTFATNPVRIGKLNFIPSPKDSVSVLIPNKDSERFEKLAPQLRIKLDEDFGKEFFKPDSDVYSSDSLFQNFFKGLYIKANGQNSGLLSFQMRNSASGLKVYMKRDTLFTDYTFPIYLFNVVSSKYTHDYSGSVAGNFIGSQGTKSDSLLFVQGLSGVNFFVEFPYVRSLPSVIVNKAELEFTILRLQQDNAIYAPPTQLFISEVKGDTLGAPIDDVTFAFNKAGEEFYRIFGGNVYNGQKYRLNISSHFQKMMSGTRSNKMRIEVYLKAEVAGRAVLGGPSHSTSPVKLKLSLTRY